MIMEKECAPFRCEARVCAKPDLSTVRKRTSFLQDTCRRGEHAEREDIPSEAYKLEGEMLPPGTANIHYI